MSEVSASGNWEKVKISDCARVVSGATPKTSEPRYWGGNIHWVTPKDVSDLSGYPFLETTPRTLTAEGLASCSAEVIPPGSVLLSSRAPIGLVAINRIPVATNQGFKNFVPDPTCLNAGFLYHWLRANRAFLESLGTGATFKEISKAVVSRIEIPLPPLDEQKRIAAVLDKTDALRRRRQESIQLSAKLLQSVFIDMFGDPMRNSKHLSTEELGHLAKLERGKFTPRPRNDPSYYGGQYPFIQTGDITRSNGRITSWTQTLNDKGAAVSKEFNPGTIVIAIVGATIGETAIVETPVYCPDSIIGITPHNDKATPEFLEFLLRLWKPRLKELAPDAARANLNLERLRPLPALAPSIEEQQAFSRIATMFRSLMLAKHESELQLSRIFSSIQQRVFRGELDLSHLVLDSPDDTPLVSQPEKPIVKVPRTEPAGLFPHIPRETEAVLEGLDAAVAKGESIPWSADYFRYRILGGQRPPFSFGDVMQKTEAIFDEPPYEEIKDMFLELLGYGGSPALLNQTFDLSIDTETNEVTGRKEIVFEPTA